MEDYSRDNRELQRLMELQRQKLEATTKEMKKEQQQVHDLKVEIGNFKAGLHSTSQHIQEPKRLKEAVKALYRKYLRDHELVCSCTCVRNNLCDQPHGYDQLYQTIPQALMFL